MIMEFTCWLICRLFGHEWYAKPNGERLIGYMPRDPHNPDFSKHMASYQQASAEKRCERCGKLADLRWEEI